MENPFLCFASLQGPEGKMEHNSPLFVSVYRSTRPPSIPGRLCRGLPTYLPVAFTEGDAVLMGLVMDARWAERDFGLE